MTLLLAFFIGTQKLQLSNTLHLPRMLMLDGYAFQWKLPKGWTTNVRPYHRPWSYRNFDGTLFNGKTGHRFEVIIWDPKNLAKMPPLKNSRSGFSYGYKDNNLWLVKTPPHLTQAHQGSVFLLFIHGVPLQDSKLLIHAFVQSRLIPPK